MSRRPYNIRENARKKGVTTKGLSNRQLCAASNSAEDCNKKTDREILENMQWNVSKILEDRGENYLVEWEPTCASERQYNIFLKNIPKEIKSIERGRMLVSWKSIEMETKNLTKYVGIRRIDEILENRGKKVLVSFANACITAETYEQEKANIDSVLDANAILIEWNDGLSPKNSYTVTSIVATEPKVAEPLNVGVSQGTEDVEINDWEGNNDDDGGQWLSKKRKTCETKTKVERKYDPSLEALVVSPDFPPEQILYAAGQELLKSKKENASTKFSAFWKKKVGSDLDKLYYIDNPGDGDCMYFAIAPMIRALKPNLFEQKVDADNDMIRLRQLIATKIGTTVDSINSYIKGYADQFSTQGQKQTFQKDNPLLTDKDNVMQRRAKLQNDLIQNWHWAHLSDFELLQKVVGPSVHIIIFESVYSAQLPPFHIVSQNTNVEGKYIMIYHTSNHFVRLQQKDGKFAFTKQEFDQSFPLISKLYNEFINPANLNLELVRFKNASLRKFPALRAKIPEKEEFDSFYYTFLRIKKGEEGEVLMNNFPAIERFSSLSEADQNRFINNVIATLNGDVKIDKNVDAGALEVIAARRVAKFVNDDVSIATNASTNSATQNTAKETVSKFCTPLTNDEEDRVKQLFEMAKANPNKSLINIDEFIFYGQVVSRLTPGQWLNDEIINWYIGEIVKAHNAKYPQKVASVSSFFYSDFLQKGRIDRLKKWSNPLQNGPLSKLFIPVNQDKQHWYLIVVNFDAKQIEIYDSICSSGERGFNEEKLVKQYLKDVLNVDITGWTLKTMPAPEQNNATDCGVFILAFVQQLQDPDFSRFTFTRADIPCFRKRIALELANKL